MVLHVTCTCCRCRVSVLSSHLSLVVRKPVFGVSDTNRAVQLQKIARGLKFRILEEEGLYYP